MGVRMKLTAGVLCSSLAWSEISEIGWTRNYDSVAWHRNYNWTYNDLQGSSKLNNDLQGSAKLIMNSDLIQSLKDLEGTGKELGRYVDLRSVLKVVLALILT